MKKSNLLAASGLVAMALNVSTPAYSMPVEDVPAETTLVSILGAISAGFGATVAAITGVSNAILSSSMTAQNVQGKLLTSQVQGIQKYYQQDADAKVAGQTYMRPANSCYFATAGLAQTAAAQGVMATNAALSNNDSVWLMGGTSATSGSGPVATSTTLVANHVARTQPGANGGAAAATMAAAQQNGYMPPPSGQADAGDWALAPANLFMAPTLDASDVSATSWAVDMQRLLGDAGPAPMPSAKSSNPELVRKSLANAAKQNSQQLVLNEAISERAPAAANMQGWLQALWQQQGIQGSPPKNVSWFQLHDALVHQVFGGAQLDLYLSSTNEEGAVKEGVMIESERLAIEWAMYQLIEKQGVAAGAAGSAQITNANH